MAIPSTPNNMIVQTANQQILISWDMSVGASFYQVQRSQDNITFITLATISGSPLAISYLDTTAVLSTNYFYQVAASSDGVNYSPYTTSQSGIAVPTGEMSLSQIRLYAQQRADRVNSQFVTNAEWNKYINQSMFELYDLLVTAYEDYFTATPISIAVNGSQYLFPLLDGSNTFTNNITGLPFIPKPFYKLLGVDLALNNATNAWVTINKFNFIDRNRFVYPNTASTIYGVFNLQYRMMGKNIEFIPTPAGGQVIRLWYIPRLTELLQETDTTDIGISGWLEYVIVRAAKYALDKEESDTMQLNQELSFLKTRIEEASSNRDAGMPDTVSNSRMNSGENGGGWGFNGPRGGF